MDLDKAISMIPICTGKKDVAEFINICEIAIKETTEADTPILLKIITSKLTGNALEVTKYRNLETWGAIKTILEGAFEQKVSERALSIALNTARMAEGESVAKFASRIEELYYKLCAASTIGLAQAEADIVKKQTKKQAMIIFMTGLPHHLYTVLKSRNPSTLEQCFKTAIDEMLEYESKVEMDKLQRQIGNGKQADVNNEEKRQNSGNTNNAVNRGGNGNSNQRIIVIIMLLIMTTIVRHYRLVRKERYRYLVRTLECTGMDTIRARDDIETCREEEITALVIIDSDGTKLLVQLSNSTNEEPEFEMILSVQAGGRLVVIVLKKK
ncbi:uncharacterized protein LOC132937604 [Metopolophium dirhodum]|uniref:uncharacterized protein LOC132937604 n=1 Tax=Metopolophium dirhodum TaxID=44670 RepID=UPI00299008DC|nr:uncharacterized protein LOC132937604 [Metopolophium dirhodum]